MERGVPPAGAGDLTSGPGSAHDELLALVERIAACFPQLSRLRILDAVETEWIRLGANLEPHLRPLVGPAAAWRLRLDADPV